MKLHQLLTESTSFPIDQLKKLMQKDDRISMIFKRGFEVDQITNFDDFIRAANKYVFDNLKVQEFVKNNGGVDGVVPPHYFQSIRKTLRVGFDPKNSWPISSAVNIIKDLLAAYRDKEKHALSKNARESLDTALIGGKMWRLNAPAAAELKALNAGASSTIRVYKAVPFSSYEVTSSGEALQFQKKIRAGTRFIDIKDDHCSLWTTSKKLARLGATHPNAAEWATEVDHKPYSQGTPRELGFVLSMLVKPSDVIVDLKKLKELGIRLPDRALIDTGIIVAPGEYTAAIAHKLVNGQDVEVVASREVADQMKVMEEVLDMLQRVIKLPKEFDGMQRSFWYTSPFRHPETIKELIKPEVDTHLRKLLNVLLSFYKKRIEPLNVPELVKVAGAEAADVSKVLLGLDKLFNKSFSYFTPTSRYADHVDFSKLENGEDLYNVPVIGTLLGVTAALKANKRITNRHHGIEAGEDLAKLIDPADKIAPHGSDAFHLRKWEFQKNVLMDVVDGLLTAAGESTSAPLDEKLKRFNELNQTIMKTYRALSFIKDIKNALEEKK